MPILPLFARNVLWDITAPKTRPMASSSAQRAHTARMPPQRQRLAPRASMRLLPAQVAPVAPLGLYRVLGMLAVTRKAQAAISIFRAGHAR